MMMESRWWNKERINILLASGCIVCLEKEHCCLCCHIWVPSTLILKINNSQQYKPKMMMMMMIITMTMRMMTATMMIKFTAKKWSRTLHPIQSSTLQILTLYNTSFNIILQYMLVISHAASYCDIFQLNVLCTNHPVHFICHFTWIIITVITAVFFTGYAAVHSIDT